MSHAPLNPALGMTPSVDTNPSDAAACLEAVKFFVQRDWTVTDTTNT